MHRRLVVASVLVAVIGLSSALLIYLTAREDGDNDPNVQILIVDGKTYRIPLANTKMYRHDLERYGGQAALLFDDLGRWFRGLWHGKTLGVTVVVITAVVSIGLLLLAREMRPLPDPGDPGEDYGTG